MEKKVTVFSISYNSGQMLSECLYEIFSEPNFSPLIVDNNSSDGSSKTLNEKFPGLEVISLSKNQGYGRAANEAFKRIKTPYALLVNPDVIMNSQQVLDLVKMAEKYPDVAVFAPDVHNRYPAGDQPVYVNEIHGSCMLFDMEKIGSLGGFDHNIFLFSEETDLCKRLADAGYDMIVFPSVRVEHLGGQSSGSSPAIEYLKRWHFGWSRSYLYQKHDLDHGKSALWRRLWLYRLKWLLALNSKNRLKYRGLKDGVAAFKRGESAFCKDNLTARMSLESGQNPYV
jgi:N-acetylglucosaminyl-diphospho-decaprenol L-rhamnosyltransferase